MERTFQAKGKAGAKVDKVVRQEGAETAGWRGQGDDAAGDREVTQRGQKGWCTPKARANAQPSPKLMQSQSLATDVPCYCYIFFLIGVNAILWEMFSSDKQKEHSTSEIWEGELSSFLPPDRALSLEIHFWFPLMLLFFKESPEINILMN